MAEATNVQQQQHQNIGVAGVASAELIRAIGIRSGVSDGLQFVDERTLLYPCGSYLVLHSLEQQHRPEEQPTLHQDQALQQQRQRFLPLGRQLSLAGVSALAVSPNRRYAAVAESPATADERAVVSIVDLQTGRVRRQVTVANTAADVATGVDFACLAFSADSKYLAGLLGEPSCQLLYWQWANNKLLGCYTPPAGSVFSQVSFNSSDPSQLSLTGHGAGGLRVLRYADGQLKPASAGVPSVRLDTSAGAISRHCWLGDSGGGGGGGLALGTDAGRLLVLEGSERRADIDLAGDGDGGSGGVRCLQPCGRGFAVAMDGGSAARVALFDRVDGGGPEAFVKTREIVIPTDDASSDEPDAPAVAIVELCVSPGDETLAVLTNRRQIWKFSLLSPLPDKGELQEGFEPLTDPCHTGPITGLDVCLQKPLIATCSADFSVRIWNYETGECTLSKRFPDEAYSVAMHPGGHQIAVGFADKLRLMTVLADGLRTIKEFQIRSCKECVFSHGGHLLAAAHGNTVQVFDTLRHHCVATLKGHSGRVRCLAWRPDDFGLVSSGQEGAVYAWDLRSGTRTWEHVLKACAYTGLALRGGDGGGGGSLGHDSSSGVSGGGVFAAGTDAGLRELADTSGENNDAGDVLRQATSASVVATSLAASVTGKALFAATAAGTLRSLVLPLDGGAASPWLEWPGHAGPTRRVRLTPREDALVTIGEDACVLVWRPLAQQPNQLRWQLQQQHRHLPLQPQQDWSNEALVPLAELAELRSRADEWRARAEEVRIAAAHEARVREAAATGERIRLEAELERRAGEAAAKEAALRADRDRVEATLTGRLAEESAAAERKLTEEAEAAERRLLREFEKMQAIQANAQRMQEDYERQLSEADKAARLEAERQSASYEAQLADLRSRLRLAEERQAEEAAKAAEAAQLMEEDADAELLATKTAYERRLHAERDSAAKTRVDLGEALSRVGMADRRAAEKAERVAALETDLERTRATVEGLRAELAGLRALLDERAAEITELQRQAEVATKELRRLEAVKFVLEHRLSETRAQLEPREQDVKTLQKQVGDMVDELRRREVERARLIQVADSLGDRARASEKAAEAEATSRRRAEIALTRVAADLHACAGFAHEPKRLRDCVIAMHRRHVGDAVVPPEKPVANEVEAEFARQRRHQESTVAGLKQKLKTQHDLLHGQYVRIMQENQGLMQQVRQQTQELARCRSEARTLQVALGLRRKDNEEAKQLLAVARQPAGPDPLEELRGEEFQRTVESQRDTIRQLRQQLGELQQLQHRQQTKPAVVAAVDDGAAGGVAQVSLPPIQAQ